MADQIVVPTTAADSKTTVNIHTETTPANPPIIPIDNWSRPFIRSVFSGSDGTGSVARVASMFSLIAAIGWITYCIYHTKSIPDLTSITYWEAMTISIFYGPNKVAEIVQTLKSKI